MYTVDDIFIFLDEVLKKNMVSHAFLLEVDDTYNTSLSLEIVKKILSTEFVDKNEFHKISSLIDNNTFPDLKIIRPDGKFIKKEQLIELMSDYKNKSLDNSRRFYIIEYAENLNLASANTILKFLEEPENDIVAILVTKNIYSVLNTIVSRCQILNCNKYIKKSYDENLVKECINYINILLTKKDKAIAYLSDLYLLKNNELREILSICLLFYEDSINYCLGKSLSNFDIENYMIENVIKNINLKDAIVKVNIIQKMINLLDFNVNSRIILDKLFLGGENGEI